MTLTRKDKGRIALPELWLSGVSFWEETRYYNHKGWINLDGTLRSWCPVLKIISARLMIIITFLLRESTFPCGNRISYVMDGYCFLPFISILNTRDKGKEGSSTHPSHAVSASKSGSPVHIGLIIIVFPRSFPSLGQKGRERWLSAQYG